MKQAAGCVNGLPKMPGAAVRIRFQILPIHFCRQILFEILIHFPTGDGIPRQDAHIPVQHLLQHTAHKHIIGRHGKGKFISGNPLDHITKAPENSLQQPRYLFAAGGVT